MNATVLESGKHFEAAGTATHSPAAKRLKLILHVGPHKTGTTSLQRALLKQYGSESPQKIWYPKPKKSGPGHALAVRQTLGRKGHSPSPAIRQLIAQADGASCQLLVLSSEDLASTYHNSVEPLLAQISDADVHIIVTLSSVARRALSIWQELVKHRSLMTLEGARDTILRRHGLAPDFVRYFAENFPSAKVSVIIADRSSPETLYKLFGEATGIPLSTPSEPRDLVANRSLGMIEANLLSAFNAGVVKAELTEEKYHEARKLLRSKFESEEWRATVPLVPLALPDNWMAPLKKQCAETMAELKELSSTGRITVFGDIQHLDDLNQMAKQAGGAPAKAETTLSSPQSVLIAGLAKSGTTALFYKIKEVMPPDTYYLFEPKKFDAKAAAGKENILAKVLLIGTEPETFAHFNKKILIVRDPRDRIVSGTLYRVFNSPDFCNDAAKVSELVDILRRKEASPPSVSMLDLIQLIDRLTGRKQLPTLADAVKKLVNFRSAHPDFFIYRYEDLVLGKFDNLSRYLGMELSDEKPSVAAEVNRVSRKQDSGDWQHWFVPEDVAYFRPLIELHMRELGYDDDWALASEPHIAPEHGSGYVAQIVKDRIAFDAVRPRKVKEPTPRTPRRGFLSRGATHCREALRRLTGRA